MPYSSIITYAITYFENVKLLQHDGYNRKFECNPTMCNPFVYVCGWVCVVGFACKKHKIKIAKCTQLSCTKIHKTAKSLCEGMY